jgi:hypothetical protein
VLFGPKTRKKKEGHLGCGDSGFEEQECVGQSGTFLSIPSQPSHHLSKLAQFRLAEMESDDPQKVRLYLSLSKERMRAMIQLLIGKEDGGKQQSAIGGGSLYTVSYANLKNRLAYFEGRLEEAQRRSAAKESHPRDFDSGYTTETFKTWGESIAIIKERIVGIQRQLKAE